MDSIIELSNILHDLKINDIKTNTLNICKGDAFLCIQGVGVDRHQFVQEAISKGACAIIASKPVESTVPVFQVQDTNAILVPLCQTFYQYRLNPIQVVGITGTDGKTSTATIYYELSNKLSKTGYIGTNGIYSKTYNLDSENTTPSYETTMKVFNDFKHDNCETVVMEVSSEGIVAGRVEGIMFDKSIFTNLSNEHLNTHKTMDAYLEAKTQLFKQTKKDGYAIINMDDDASDKIISVCKCHVMTYGTSALADVQITDIELQSVGIRFKLKMNGIIFPIESNLVGEFNIYNLTAALIALILDGYSLVDLMPYLSSLTIPGRMNLIDVGQDYQVLIDYAHTPNGLKQLFKYTNNIKLNKSIVVIGSAGLRDVTKRPEMGRIATENNDFVIFTSEDPRTEDPYQIACELASESNKDKYEIITDRKKAIEYAINIAKSGDVVMVLGKGVENYQVHGNQKIYFNDYETAKQSILDKLKAS